MGELVPSWPTPSQPAVLLLPAAAATALLAAQVAVFAGFGLVALVAGATLVGQVAVGAALVAALLNAVFDICRGCELSLLGRRSTA